jgi:hypothetical protein
VCQERLAGYSVATPLQRPNQVGIGDGKRLLPEESMRTNESR